MDVKGQMAAVQAPWYLGADCADKKGADWQCQNYYRVYIGITRKRRSSLTELAPYAPEHNMFTRGQP